MDEMNLILKATQYNWGLKYPGCWDTRTWLIYDDGNCEITGMVGALFELSHKVFPEREIFVRIRKENLVSRHVAEKNGAQFVREVDPPEVVAIRTLLEHNKELSRADEAKAAIERSKDSVLLYKV